MCRVASVAGMLLAAVAIAQETRPSPGNPLAALPSPAGAHVARIRAMAGDSWLILGPPAPDPQWGRARGRSWTPRMPCAPALRAAFLCGCGIHGYVKPDGHFMDDLWAYDINAHRWICLYAGAPVKTLSLRLDANGFEVNARGEHIPVSFMGHGYCNQTYIPDRGLVMFIYTHSPWWTRAIPQRWEWLDQNDPDVKRRNYGHAGAVIEAAKHPLFYNVAAGRWERRFVSGDGPGPRRFEGVLEYIPAKKQAMFLCHGRVWFYDFATNTWTAAKAEKVNVAYDSWGCYDTKRNRVYVARKEIFLAYDVEKDAWSSISGEGQPSDLGSCAYGAVTYDEVADSVVFLLKNAGIFIYDPGRNAWRRGADLPDVQWKRHNVNGFYDRELNVHFYHLAGDSADDGVMLVYRCTSGQSR